MTLIHKSVRHNNLPWALTNAPPVPPQTTPEWDKVTPFAAVAKGFLNASASTLTTPFITTLHMAQRGDIPAGSVPCLFTSSGQQIPTQVDLVAPPHTDGSFSAGAISAVLPGTMTANGTPGDTLNYVVKPVLAGTQTPAFSMSAWNAANDMSVIFRTNLANLADDSANYRFKISDCIAAGIQEGVGTGSGYPLYSYRTDRSGSVCMGWRFRGYARQISTGAYRTDLLIEIYVTARTAAANNCLVEVALGMPAGVETGGIRNALQTIGPKTGANFAPLVGICELWNNGIKKHTWGGPTDWRATTFGPNAVNVATNQIYFPLTGNGQSKKLAYVFSSTGTLPTGIAPNRPYYVIKQDNVFFPERCTLWTRRAYQSAFLNTNSPWTAGKVQGAWNQSNNVYTGTLNTSNWALNTWWAAVTPGTSGTTAPSGTGPVVDGSVTWEQMNVRFVDQGTGTISAWPVLDVSPYTQTLLCDEATTDPLWLGTGPAPNVEVQLDLTYHLRYARALPPYDLTITRLYADNYETWQGFSAAEPCVAQSIDDFGDDPGTNLVGYLNVHATNALLQQRNVKVQRYVRDEALRWPHHWTTIEDPRSMMPVVCTPGPGAVPGTAGAAGTYSGMGPSLPGFYFAQPAITTAVGGFSGPAIGFNASYYSAKYRRYCDPSHLPAMWVLPYHKTARTIFLDNGVGLTNAAAMAGSNQQTGSPVLKLGTKTYYTVGVTDNQVRGCGWYVRCLGTIDDVLPATHPCRAFISDLVQGSIDTAIAVINWNQINDPVAYKLGMMTWEKQGAVQTFFFSMLMQSLAQEARKGKRPGWRVICEHLSQNRWMPQFNDDIGGNAGLVDHGGRPLNWVTSAIAAGVPVQIRLSSGALNGAQSNPNLPPALTYTPPPGVTRASAAQDIVNLINSTPSWTNVGFVASYKEGSYYIRGRMTNALFRTDNKVQDAFIAASPGIGLGGGGGPPMYVGNDTGGKLRSFTDWNDLRDFWLGENWPKDKTWLSYAGTGGYVTYESSVFSNVGWFPWGTTGYPVVAMSAIAVMAEAGIVDAAKNYDQIMTRIRNTARDTPEFSGPVSGKLGTGNRTFANFAMRTWADQAANPQ